jgi:hypothetical protein
MLFNALNSTQTLMHPPGFFDSRKDDAVGDELARIKPSFKFASRNLHSTSSSFWEIGYKGPAFGVVPSMSRIVWS